MKKIPFYNPASPLFFHIAVLLLYIIIFLLFLSPFFIIRIILIFSAVYPFFMLVMAVITRRAYINTYQALVPEEFADKLLLYNRYLITAIYVFSLGAGVIESDKCLDAALVCLFLVFISGLCFLFYFYILPIIVRLILLKKTIFILGVVILGILFLFFLLGLYFFRLLRIL